MLALNVQPAPTSNNVVVTSPSTINLGVSPSGTLGTLSIGTTTLNITGVSGVTDTPYTLTFGATTLTGNPTFNIANNGAGTGTLRLGAIGDGASARTITTSGPGTLALSAAATSLIAGTKFNINAGVVNPLVTGAMGTLAQVTIANGGTLNLGANQTISTLAGLGTVNLNTSTLTVGSTDNLSSSFPGLITDAGLGTGGLNKGGTGTTSMLAGGNTYTGPTSVNTGTLVIANAGGSATGSGNVTVLSGAKLSGPSAMNLGFISGGVTVNSTGTILAASGASLSLGSLTLPAGSISSFALGLPNGPGGPALIHTSLGGLNSLAIRN